MDDAMRGTLASWYASTPLSAAARDRLMTRLHADAVPAAVQNRERSQARRHTRERTPARSVARGLAAIAVAASLVVVVARSRAGGEGSRTPHVDPVPYTTPARAASDVGFALQLSDASVRHVSLAGDFNGWNPTALPMQRDPVTGTWRTRVHLVPGRHEYSYVVNGTRWVIDPLAPRTMEQTMGPTNVITVPGDL